MNTLPAELTTCYVCGTALVESKIVPGDFYCQELLADPYYYPHFECSFRRASAALIPQKYSMALDRKRITIYNFPSTSTIYIYDFDAAQEDQGGRDISIDFYIDLNEIKRYDLINTIETLHLYQ